MDNRRADELIRMVGQGDMTALEELYNSLSRGVYALVMTIVKNTSAAEDIMQDTFVRVYNAAPDFKANGAGVAWIMRIARNLALNAVTAKKILPEDSLAAMPSSVTAENSAIDRVMINRALDKLTEQEREIVTLHAVVGMTLGEIAKLTDQPLGTVKWRHSAALKKLRSYLD